MVMPRSRSIGLLSSTCDSISRAVRPPQSWMMRSARVDLPWSTWAMMEKLRMFRIWSGAGGMPGVPGQTRDYRMRDSVHGHRDELDVAAAVEQQHHRGAGLDVAQGAVELGRGADRGAADAQHHVARTQAGAAGRLALDPGNGHALAGVQVQRAALVGVQGLADQSQRVVGLVLRPGRRGGAGAGVVA